MANTIATRYSGQPNPSAIYHYLDGFTVWFENPLNANQITHLNSMNRRDSPLPHLHRGKCPFHSTFKQSLTLRQPTKAQRQYLARIRKTGYMFTHIEIARDYVFDERDDANRCVEWCRDHLLQPYHRASMQVHVYGDHGFTSRKTPKGGRKKGTWTVGYDSKECRITGEVYCFHIETRHSGRQAIHRLGIDSFSDLLNFDFKSHFKKHLTCYDLDYERLGRYHRNKQSGGRSRCGRIDTYKSGLVYNHDLRIGGFLYQHYAIHPDQWEYSLQQFVDQYGRGPFLVEIAFQPFKIDIHRCKCETTQQTIAAQPLLESPRRVQTPTPPNSLKIQKTPATQPLLASQRRRKPPKSLQTPKMTEITPLHALKKSRESPLLEVRFRYFDSSTGVNLWTVEAD